MLEPEEAAILLILAINKKKKRKSNRTLWVHPIISSRLEEGCFYILFHKLREDERQFFNYFRMSISSFDELHNSLRFSFHQRDTNMRRCIPAVERIAVTLRQVTQNFHVMCNETKYLYQCSSQSGVFIRQTHFQPAFHFLCPITIIGRLCVPYCWSMLNFVYKTFHVEH